MLSSGGYRERGACDCRSTREDKKAEDFQSGTVQLLNRATSPWERDAKTTKKKKNNLDSHVFALEPSVL
ncbi:hypothetical protein EYF80_037219 [Liparis tanakae]|uniref:Uncharacterized protein n=1 Tax=Liparis tanakae TaxID=230148 RepID=A0A4Z2GHE6_9TELE|nr:hypothetical protein EYF80_037219 [Liparis tanakae]